MGLSFMLETSEGITKKHTKRENVFTSSLKKYKEIILLVCLTKSLLMSREYRFLCTPPEM